MKEYSPVRFIAFAAGAVMVAIVIFYALSLAIGPHFELGTDLIERWIVRATCADYELSGVVHDQEHAPVRFAFVDVAYLDQHMMTRTGLDGRFSLKSKSPFCERQSDVVKLRVSANTYRSEQRVLKFDDKTVEVTLYKLDL